MGRVDPVMERGERETPDWNNARGACRARRQGGRVEDWDAIQRLVEFLGAREVECTRHPSLRHGEAPSTECTLEALREAIVVSLAARHGDLRTNKGGPIPGYFLSSGLVASGPLLAFSFVACRRAKIEEEDGRQLHRGVERIPRCWIAASLNRILDYGQRDVLSVGKDERHRS